MKQKIQLALAALAILTVTSHASADLNPKKNFSCFVLNETDDMVVLNIGTAGKGTVNGVKRQVTAGMSSGESVSFQFSTGRRSFLASETLHIATQPISIETRAPIGDFEVFEATLQYTNAGEVTATCYQHVN